MSSYGSTGSPRTEKIISFNPVRGEPVEPYELKFLYWLSMNNRFSYIIISIASFCAALLFFAFYNQLIVLCVPRGHNNGMQTSLIVKKKQIIHHYFSGDKWKIEKQALLWHDSSEKNIFHLVNAWLALLDEEHAITKKTILQSVLIDNSGCIYLSFDHTMFGKEDTIFKKWMLIEGLLKTMVVNGISFSQVQFLVQHQLLHDTHLDFSQPWPIHGFMNGK